MKRILEITEEVEKSITQLCDTALKNAGLAAHDLVAKVKSAWVKIESVEDQPEQK